MTFEYELPKENNEIKDCSGYAEGLSIVNCSGLYHIFFTADKEKMANNNLESLWVCTEDDILRNLRALSMLVKSRMIRKYTHEGMVNYVNAIGSGRYENLTKEETDQLTKELYQGSLLANQQVNSDRYAVVYVTDLDDEEIVLKTASLSDAIAWCAMIVKDEYAVDTELFLGNTFRYEVHELNANKEIDICSVPLYFTPDCAL